MREYIDEYIAKSKSMKIIWKRVQNEAMVKFEVAYLLKKNKIPFALEYKVCWNEIPDYNSTSHIFDVLIFDDDENAIGIIECKKNSRPKGMESPQIKRYQIHNIPIFLADGQSKIDEALEFAKSIYTPKPKKKKQEPIKMDAKYYTGLFDDEY